ncbi:MAG: hypothetical protein HUJ96_06880 [Marinilabiliaceae bacterium]|nr:hypothetical protein [Marinilabiliaceae bacterium]
MFVDSDDTLRSNAIEKLVDVVNTNLPDVVFLGYIEGQHTNGSINVMMVD